MNLVKICKKTKNETPATVYDVAVQDAHHYILSDGVVSHNSFIPMDVVAGGGGPAYGASITIMITKAQLKENDVVVGAKLRIKTDKNRFAKEKMEITATIDFDGGLDKCSGLLDFCYNEGIFTPNSAVPKSGDIRKIKSWTYKGEVIATKTMDEPFWVNLLNGELGTILHNKFKYMSVKDELLPDTDDEDDDE